VPEPIAFGFKMAIEKTKGHKSPGTDHIPAEMFKVGSKTICSVLLKLINSIWNKGELPEEWDIWNERKLPEEWNESISLPIY
jgi:hypothetical protein